MKRHHHDLVEAAPSHARAKVEDSHKGTRLAADYKHDVEKEFFLSFPSSFFHFCDAVFTLKPDNPSGANLRFHTPVHTVVEPSNRMRTYYS